MLKHLIEKDFAQPPEFDLANELDCRPNCIPGGAPAAFIHITGTQAAPGARGPTARTCAQPPVGGLRPAGLKFPITPCLFPQHRSPASAPEELEVTGQS